LEALFFKGVRNWRWEFRTHVKNKTLESNKSFGGRLAQVEEGEVSHEVILTLGAQLLKPRVAAERPVLRHDCLLWYLPGEDLAE
jgi:hypothetical protein